jgi:hypothetical protein
MLLLAANLRRVLDDFCRFTILSGDPMNAAWVVPTLHGC